MEAKAYLQIKKLESKKEGTKMPVYLVCKINICGLSRRVFLSDNQVQNLLDMSPRTISELPVGYESQKFPIDITLINEV